MSGPAYRSWFGSDYMEFDNAALTRLLTLTKRQHTIAGKKQNQVEGTMLHSNLGRCYTTNLVRDGVSSLSRFSMACDGEKTIPVPNIDTLLGVLPYHSATVKLNWDDNRLKVKSSSKQTTITASSNAPAFANSQDSLAIWSSKSDERALQIDPSTGTYKMQSGETRKPILSVTLTGNELYEALRCDAINGQKLNRYTFRLNNNGLSVEVGDELKGKTSTNLSADNTNDEFSVTFEGGLDTVLKHYPGDVQLHFIDFREEGQGIRLLIQLADGLNPDFVFQAGLLR